MLPRSTPAAQGLDATGLLDLLDDARGRGLALHSLMVARHGHVVAQTWWPPYGPDGFGLVYSLSKSFTAAAVGFCVQEGLLGVDQPVLEVLGVDPAGLHPNWARVTVRHCLTMTVGHDTEAWPQVVDRADPDPARLEPGADWLPLVLATEPVHEPGTHFAYNQVATYLLSLAVHRVSGGGLLELLRPRLLEPLGIDRVAWQRDPMGRELGFSGIHVTTSAVLALAQLTLDRGRWQDRQLLEDAWFDDATRAHGPLNADPSVGPDWRRGYGFSYWMQRYGFRGDGAFGQFAVVLPDQDVAVAITGETERMQDVLDLLWRHLVPAVDRTGPADADARLADRLEAIGAGADTPPPGGRAASEPQRLPRAAGSDLAARYHAVTVAGDGADGTRLTLHRDGGDDLTLIVGAGAWRASDLVADGRRLPVVAAGGTQPDGRFCAEVVMVQTPHRFTVSTGPDGAELRWRIVPLSGPDPMALGVHRA